MMDTPPSREWAVHTSLPSGDSSMPSGPLPTGITVCAQVPPDPCSISEMLFDAMFAVKIRRLSFESRTMCVASWPVSNFQSIRSA